MEENEKIDSFTEIVRQHESYIRGCIRIMGVPLGSVDDLAQETFIIAFRKYDPKAENPAIRSWLLTIARNLVLNERRKTSRRLQILNENYSEFANEKVDSILEDIKLQESISAVKACVNELPENHREIILLKYREKATSIVIGEHMRRDPSTIRQMLKRTVDKLRKCVDFKLGEGLYE